MQWSQSPGHGLIKSVSIGTSIPKGWYCSRCGTKSTKRPKKCTEINRKVINRDKLAAELEDYPTITLEMVDKIIAESELLEYDFIRILSREASNQDMWNRCETREILEPLFGEEWQAPFEFFNDVWSNGEIPDIYDTVQCNGNKEFRQSSFEKWDTWDSEYMDIWKQFTHPPVEN